MDVFNSPRSKKASAQPRSSSSSVATPGGRARRGSISQLFDKTRLSPRMDDKERKPAAISISTSKSAQDDGGGGVSPELASSPTTDHALARSSSGSALGGSTNSSREYDSGHGNHHDSGNGSSGGLGTTPPPSISSVSSDSLRRERSEQSAQERLEKALGGHKPTPTSRTSKARSTFRSLSVQLRGSDRDQLAKALKEQETTPSKKERKESTSNATSPRGASLAAPSGATTSPLSPKRVGLALNLPGSSSDAAAGSLGVSSARTPKHNSAVPSLGTGGSTVQAMKSQIQGLDGIRLPETTKKEQTKKFTRRFRTVEPDLDFFYQFKLQEKDTKFADVPPANAPFRHISVFPEEIEREIRSRTPMMVGASGVKLESLVSSNQATYHSWFAEMSAKVAAAKPANNAHLRPAVPASGGGSGSSSSSGGGGGGVSDASDGDALSAMPSAGDLGGADVVRATSTDDGHDASGDAVVRGEHSVASASAGAEHSSTSSSSDHQIKMVSKRSSVTIVADLDGNDQLNFASLDSSSGTMVSGKPSLRASMNGLAGLDSATAAASSSDGDAMATSASGGLEVDSGGKDKRKRRGTASQLRGFLNKSLNKKGGE